MSLEGPIAIVSVVGKYRTGKSFLSNRVLIDRSDGFGVGSTTNACTQGIWIWGEVIHGTQPDGTPIKIIIFDTEGLGETTDNDSTYDVRIFTLATLLCSYLIYNSLGAIDSTSLD